uniref:SPX domain-containing protein n=1 Tax=Amphimedon queenslandica TaxID=400682 RepID=A0A1X7T578_AMPQE
HESELSHQLQHLAEQVDTFSQARRIKNSNRKRNSLIKAFCEFYYHLSLLQNFQKLNHTGFRKILKKHDKLASSDRGSKFFKENVEKSYFHKSKEINALVQRTEDIMINQLENGNRGRAMAKLRVPPLGGVSSPWAILASGWLMGAIFIMAVVAIIA